MDDSLIMMCPFCEHENLPGEDFCEACRQPLTGDLSRFARLKTPLERRIESEPLSMFARTEPVTVSPSDTVAKVVGLLADRRIGCVLVVWMDALVGIFSERDALMKIGTRLDAAASEPIRHFMTPAPETLTTDDTIAFAINRMAVGGFRHIPIAKDERPVSIISVRDVLGYFAEQFPEISARS